MSRWPPIAATVFFLALLVFIRPWSDLPLNDDWQYAHVAKNFAERGNLRVDVGVAPTLVGQTVLAWPVVRVFGFSHLALRIMTICLSVMILLETDYLLSRTPIPAVVRFIALGSLVANPLFLHFSTTFMTENYGYFVALLAACIWFYGREKNRVWIGVLAAAVAGTAFWIRQLSALVFPALILAELIVGGFRAESLRSIAKRRALALGVWVAMVAAYFPWAVATGNYKPQFSGPLSFFLSPVPFIVAVQLGIGLFYVTLFFAPFLFAYMRRRGLSILASLPPLFLVLTAGFAWLYGNSSGSPRARLHSLFPFLPNVITPYGVGPLTLTDVYVDGVHTRPHVPDFPWVMVEILAIVLSLGWIQSLARVKTTNNEIGIFGICFALISFVIVALSFQMGIFDRYHYSALLGLTLSLAVFFPRENVKRLQLAAIVWIGGMAIFSTLALHDYFRWNEARADILKNARQRGIALSEIDAGYEPNGWNAVEGLGPSTDCRVVAMSCKRRPYRIGLEQRPSDKLIMRQRVPAWLVPFPDVKLLHGG